MSNENRRKYFREEIIVPAQWQTLTDHEIELVKNGFGDTLFKGGNLPSPIDELMEQTPPGSDEEFLYRCLQLINNKLDFIIDQIFLKPGERRPKRGEVVDLSGSGLKFRSQDRLEAGTFLKLNLIVPGTFQYQLNLIIETMRFEERRDGFIIAAKIVDISEEDRDAIIKVVLQKQRNDIRKKKFNQEGNVG